MRTDQNLSIKEVATRAVEIFLETKVVTKDNLIDRIIPILKVYLQTTTKPIKTNRRTAKVHKLQWTVKKADTEATFWRNKIRSIVSEEDIKALYIECNKHAEDLGLKNYIEE